MHLSRGTRTTEQAATDRPLSLNSPSRRPSSVPRLKYAPMKGPSGVRARLSPRFQMSPLSPRSAAYLSVAPRRCLSTLLFLAAIAFPCVMLYHAAGLGFPFTTSSYWPSRDYLAASFDAAFPDQDTDQLEKNDVKLEKVLKEAAMENKTTGDGTRRLLDHLVIIALDKKAYIR